MSIFGGTFMMLGSSWQVLKKDKEMVVFFLLGMAAQLALVYFAYLNFMKLYPDGFDSLRQDLSGERKDLYIAGFALVAAYQFTGQFFNAAIVGSAARRFSGGNPTVLTGLWDAFKRLPSLLIWSVLYAALLTLTGLFKRKGKARKAVGGAVQAAFHVATYLVLPLIMIENANPFSAMGRSAGLMGRTWGHQIAANVSLYVARFLISLPGAALAAAGVYYNPQNTQMQWLCAGAGAALVVLGAGIVRTLSEIFRTALYLYVRDHKAPAGFDSAQLQSAFASA